MGVRVRAALRLICAISILSGAAWAQLARYDGFVAPAGYNFGPANVAICQAGGSGGPPCSPLALVYGDVAGTYQISQPFQADINGHYYFYAPAGSYVTDTYGAGYSTTLTNITLGSSGGGTVTAGGNNSLVGVNTASSLNGVLTVDGHKYTTIQAALNDVPAGGAEVFLPCGTYVPTATITISNPVKLVGASQGCVTIQPAANPTFDVINVTANNVSLSNLTVDGNASASSNYSGIVLTDGTNPVSGITLDHVTVQNTGNYCFGWSTTGAVSSVIVTNSTFTGCAQREFYGIWTSGSSAGSNFTFSNNIFGSNTAPANNTSPAGYWAAFILGVNSAAAATNVIANNNIVLYPVFANSAESDGFILSTGGTVGASISQVSVSNNVVSGPAATTPNNGHGLELWGVSQATVAANYFGPAYNPVLLQLGATGILCNANISGNTFYNPNGPNITVNITNGCPAVVQGNYFDTLTNAIVVAASQVSVSNNSFKQHSNSDVSIHLKCQETAGCLSDSVSGNVIHSVANGSCMLTDGAYAFKNISITGNTCDTTAFFIKFSSQLDTGFLAANVFGAVTQPYLGFPPGMRVIDNSTVAGICTGTATSSSTLGLYGTGPNETTTTCTSTTLGSGIPMTYSGTLGYLYANATHAGVNASSGVVTVLKNGATTTITCTIGTGTFCEDRTHQVSFVAGDLISLQFTTQATEVLAGVSATIMQIN